MEKAIRVLKVVDGRYEAIVVVGTIVYSGEGSEVVSVPIIFHNENTKHFALMGQHAWCGVAVVDDFLGCYFAQCMRSVAEGVRELLW